MYDTSDNTTMAGYWELPKGVKYDDISVGEKDNFLSGWFEMTRGFVAAVMNEPPYDLITKFVDQGSFEIVKDLPELLKAESGFMACLVFGFLFLLGMLIAGPIVCCCRCCCNNCGGKRYQRNADNVRCRRQTYVTSLFVFLVFISIGIACSFLSVGRVFNTLDKSDDTILKVVWNAKVFTNNTLQQAKYLSTKGVTVTIDKTIERTGKVRDYGMILGNNLQDILNFDDIKNGSIKLNDDFKTLTETLEKFRSPALDLKVLESKAGSLKTRVENFKSTECTTNTLDCDRLNSSVLELVLPTGVSKDSISQDAIVVGNIGSKTDLAASAQAKLERIPEEAVDNTKDIREEVIKTLHEFRSRIGLNNEVSHAADEGMRYVNIFYDNVKELIHDNLGKAKESTDYPKYANLATTIFVILVLIPTVLWFLGLVAGILGHSDDHYTKPVKRGCLSNCGGILLMLGVYLFFFLSFVAMLGTIVFFQVGGHVEVYACQPLFQTDFTALDKIYHIMSGKFEGNLTKDFIPSNILQNCEKDQTTVMAFGLYDRVKTELDKYASFLNQTDIDTQLDKIELIPADFLQFYTDFKVFVDSQELREIEQLQTKLPYKTEDLRELITTINHISSLDAHQALVQDLEKFVEDYENSAWGKSAELIKSNLDTLNQIKNAIKDVGIIDNTIKNVASDYINSVLEPGNAYIEFIKDSIANHVAKCRILWDTFDVFRNVVCKDIVDPLNGYWFGQGWCIFFEIFAAFCATKLSRHFYRMEKQDVDDGGYKAYDYDASSRSSIYDGRNMRENAMPMYDKSRYSSYFCKQTSL